MKPEKLTIELDKESARECLEDLMEVKDHATKMRSTKTHAAREQWQTGKPPEVVMDYLVTTEHGRIDIARYTNINEWWHTYDAEWHWEHPPYTHVIAWMPLPEPYKRAEWIWEDEYHLDNVVSLKCSICGQGMWHARQDEEAPNYCCNCGARMEGIKGECV